ncbi:hypothetical protein, unknown function [Leishmania tarentolae]|uniref:3'-5' exonuclease domain-containing protein n=1 Tax=Leishmania tarentolae TaxID=5689 RepID=A0A640KQ68_LEITA|nr:hypothetical protein, unknown function [Leishmania tarentolae]
MMPPAVEVGKPAFSIEEGDAKDLDEVNTHASMSLCSTSSSTDACGHTMTATTVATPIAGAPSSIVKRGSSSISNGSNECVSCDLQMPTPPTPCEFLEDLSLATTGTGGALCAKVKVVNDPATLALTPTSPLSTMAAKRTVAPPHPIDFLETTLPVVGAAGGVVGVHSSSSKYAPSVPLSSSRPEDASGLSAVAAAAPPFSAASYSGKGLRPPLPHGGLHSLAGICHVEKSTAIDSTAMSSLFSTPEQVYATPCDYLPLERRLPETMSSLRYCEQRTAVKSGLPPKPYLGNRPVSLRDAQYPPSIDSPHDTEVGSQACGTGVATHGQAAGSSPLRHGHVTSSACSPAGLRVLSAWRDWGLADDGSRYDSCIDDGSVDGVMGARGISVAPSSGADHNSLSTGMLDSCGRRPQLVACRGCSPPTPPRGLYPSAPIFSPAHASAPQQIAAMQPHHDLMDMGGAQYEYSASNLPGYNCGREYGYGGSVHFRDCVPQEVECIERVDHLDHVCCEILRESEMLLMQREQRRRECLYTVDDNNVVKDHWGDTLTIALDLEGRSLGRMGSICIITLATYSTVYIIDMVMLGAEALQAGSPLKRVLESRYIMKLMFDCRADCDALFFLYGVRLQSVCDLQISSCFALFPTSPSLPGMKSVFLSLGLFTDEDTGIKNAGRYLFNPSCGGSFDRWEERPLTDVLLHYCTVDVKYFFAAQLMLWDHVDQGCRLGEARLASVCSGNFRGWSQSNSLRDFDARKEL